MRITVISVGHKMPDWVNTAWHEYARRLPANFQLLLKEIEPAPRAKNAPVTKSMALEKDKILSAIPAKASLVCLDEKGKNWSTRELAQQLESWQLEFNDIAIVIGGADGLAPELKQQARQIWSLSRLTFPHMLVRVIVAEQIYRAWSVLANHPYHRD
jgi:23S rRNA (pseudouridine1915-N3)-methyltransferase